MDHGPDAGISAVKKKLSEVVAREAVVPAGASQLLIWDTEITRYGLRGLD